MSATVKIGGILATITDYQWSSDNKQLQNLLNAALPETGPSGADPNPDHTAALNAIEAFGGEIVSFDEAEHVSGRIY